MTIDMDYESALGYVGSLKSFNGAPTLERMRRLMKLLGDPQRTLNIIHVAGTNGKGSTAAMIASILRAAGIKTGLTVSPYIVDFCERIQINGEMIPREQLARELSHVRDSADFVGGVTQFEVITAAAYAYFARESCGAVVTEVGLGGRFDATNVIEHPLVSVITSIGLDHTAILGDTIELIAAEKCGIIKSGSPVVCAPGQRPAALGVIRAAARERGCELTEPNLDDISRFHMSLDGSEFQYKGLHIRLPLIGRHQIANALTAIDAVSAMACGTTAATPAPSGIGTASALAPRGTGTTVAPLAPSGTGTAALAPSGIGTATTPAPSGGIAAAGAGETPGGKPARSGVGTNFREDELRRGVGTNAHADELWCGAVTRGLAEVTFPARLELMRENPPVLLDGAHNPDGMRSLAEAFELLGGRPVTAVMGMLADKDVEAAVAVIAPGCRRIFCVTPKNPRALAAAMLSGIVGKYCGEVSVFEDTKAALAAAVAQAEREGGAAVVCGSLYLAAEVRPELACR